MANESLLAEFGRLPLQIHFWQIHFWQQILHYLHTVASDNSRLVKLAMVDGCALGAVGALGYSNKQRLAILCRIVS